MARVMDFPPSKSLKVPKCEIFDRSDFHDFYTIKSLWGGDFGVKISSKVSDFYFHKVLCTSASLKRSFIRID